jgi:hypothetical protein
VNAASNNRTNKGTLYIDVQTAPINAIEFIPDGVYLSSFLSLPRAADGRKVTSKCDSVIRRLLVENSGMKVSVGDDLLRILGAASLGKRLASLTPP